MSGDKLNLFNFQQSLPTKQSIILLGASVKSREIFYKHMENRLILETKGMEKGQGNIKDHSHQGIILKLTNYLNHKGHLIVLIVRGAKKNQTQ